MCRFRRREKTGRRRWHSLTLSSEQLLGEAGDREVMGEEMFLSDWKTEQALTGKVMLLNFIAQAHTTALPVFNIKHILSVIPFCHLPTQPSSGPHTASLETMCTKYTHQNVTLGNTCCFHKLPLKPEPSNQ